MIESVLVKFTSGEHEAWGEACTLGAPTYSPEHAAGIFSALTEHFVELVVGEEFESSEELHFALRWFKGNQFAKAALDTAWWGLRSVERGVPCRIREVLAASAAAARPPSPSAWSASAASTARSRSPSARRSGWASRRST